MKNPTCALLLAACAGLLAQDPQPVQAPKRAWTDKGSLSFVSVGGNAQSQTFGFSNEFKVGWGPASLAFNLGGIRVNTTTFNRTASGPDLGHAVVYQTETTATTAETYFANLRYDHTMSERFLWFTSAAWDRNVPSGIDSRLIANAGVGYWWIKRDRTRWRTDLGAGYTRIVPVLATPGAEDRYASWVFGTSFEQQFLAASTFNTSLQLTDSFKNSQDYQAVWQTGLSVAMSTRLALKVAYNLVYKNLPASVAVDVVQTPVANPPVILGQVPVLLKKADTTFTTSLVITF